jgi:uncharacterized OB-fold protein
MCPKCHSIEKTHQRLTGRGVVISWVKQVRPASYGFESSPFVILVELDEGLRIVSNLISVSVPVIGDIVEVDFEKTIGGKSVPIFKRVVV